jgi:enoyl-CoA hydratase/carnithine racemase
VTDTVLYQRDGRIATLTYHRPQAMNAINAELRADLNAAWVRFRDDDEAWVAIVTGAGRAFCAGADLEGGGSTFDVATRSFHSFDDGTPRDGGGEVSLRIYECTKPVIAAINGPAVGVGITMTLPMDVRLAVEGAKIGFVFTRRGIVPEAASSYFLPRVVGISRAMEWVATGRVFTSEEALAGGLVRSIHPAGELMPAAHALAREIADNTAPVSVAVGRRLLWSMLGATHPLAAHAADSRAMTARGASADAAEGVTAFLEKRDAVFPDRVSEGLPDLGL